jgi:hypothetical protein
VEKRRKTKMSYCEFKLARANTEEDLESAIRQARLDGWFRTGPNRTSGDSAVRAVHYCVLSRIQAVAVNGGGASVVSFFEARQSEFWRSGVVKHAAEA